MFGVLPYLHKCTLLEIQIRLRETNITLLPCCSYKWQKNRKRLVLMELRVIIRMSKLF